jgi:hypothetical protein
VNPTKQKRHKACFTDKYRKRMKKQNADKIVRKNERERARRAEKADRRSIFPRQWKYPVWELERKILLRRLRDLLVQRIGTLGSDPSNDGIRSILQLWFPYLKFTRAHIIFEEEPVPATGAETLLLPEGNSTAVSPVCPLCNMVITPDPYRFNVKQVKFQGKPLLVHKVCPHEPGYVWLREEAQEAGGLLDAEVFEMREEKDDLPRRPVFLLLPGISRKAGSRG